MTHVGKLAVKESAIVLGSKRHYVGTAPYPYPPAKGDLWTEYDSSNNFIEDWVWNGTYWLSTQKYEARWDLNSSLSISNNSISLFPSVDVNINAAATNNLFLLSFKVVAMTNNTLSNTNYWTINLFRLTSTGVRTTISSLNNSIGSPDVWRGFENILNLHLNVGSLQIYSLGFSPIRVGNPGPLFPICVCYYRKARS